MKKQKFKSEVVGSASAASARTGLPLAVVEKARASGCEAFRQNGRIDLYELCRWLATHPVNPVVMAGEEQAKEELLRERIRRARFENEVREGKYLLRENADAVAVAYVTGAKAKLLEATASLAPRLAMEGDAQEVERELRQMVVDYLQFMADGNWHRQGAA